MYFLFSILLFFCLGCNSFSNDPMILDEADQSSSSIDLVSYSKGAPFLESSSNRVSSSMGSMSSSQPEYLSLEASVSSIENVPRESSADSVISSAHLSSATSIATSSASSSASSNQSSSHNSSNTVIDRSSVQEIELGEGRVPILMAREIKEMGGMTVGFKELEGDGAVPLKSVEALKALKSEVTLDYFYRKKSVEIDSVAYAISRSGELLPFPESHRTWSDIMSYGTEVVYESKGSNGSKNILYWYDALERRNIDSITNSVSTWFMGKGFMVEAYPSLRIKRPQQDLLAIEEEGRVTLNGIHEDGFYYTVRHDSYYLVKAWNEGSGVTLIDSVYHGYRPFNNGGIVHYLGDAYTWEAQFNDSLSEIRRGTTSSFEVIHTEKEKLMHLITNGDTSVWLTQSGIMRYWDGTTVDSLFTLNVGEFGRTSDTTVFMVDAIALKDDVLYYEVLDRHYLPTLFVYDLKSREIVNELPMHQMVRHTGLPLTSYNRLY
ncbi:MAG: hypothetical protein OCC49_18435 [Fibrobacterales bacterium]